jgi:hypothetical protein
MLNTTPTQGPTNNEGAGVLCTYTRREAGLPRTPGDLRPGANQETFALQCAHCQGTQGVTECPDPRRHLSGNYGLDSDRIDPPSPTVQASHPVRQGVVPGSR